MDGRDNFRGLEGRPYFGDGPGSSGHLGCSGGLGPAGYQPQQPKAVRWIQRILTALFVCFCLAAVYLFTRPAGQPGDPRSGVYRDPRVTSHAAPGPGTVKQAVIDGVLLACNERLPATTGFWYPKGPAEGGWWFKVTNVLSTPLFVQVIQDRYSPQQVTGIIQAGESSWFTWPAAHVQLTLGVGTQWCSAAAGWSDGVRTRVTGGLWIEPNAKSVELTVGASLSKAQALLLSTRQDAAKALRGPFDAATGGSASSSESKGSDGQSRTVFLDRVGTGYGVMATLNGRSIDFLVDTGATLVSVPEQLGRELGVSSCQKRVFWTANGKTEGCVGRVQTLVIGDAVYKDTEVALMPNLPTPLMGMNVLSRWDLVEVNGRPLLRMR